MTGGRRVRWVAFAAAAAAAAYAGLAAGRWVVGPGLPADPPAPAAVAAPVRPPAPDRYPLPSGLADITFTNPAKGELARRLEDAARRLAGPGGNHRPYAHDPDDGPDLVYRAWWSAVRSAGGRDQSVCLLARARPSAPTVATGLGLLARVLRADRGWSVEVEYDWPSGGPETITLDATHPDLHGFNLWHGRHVGEVVGGGRRYRVEVCPGCDDPVPWRYHPKRPPDAYATPDRLRDVLLAELDRLEARVRSGVTAGWAFTTVNDRADLPPADVREAYLAECRKEFDWRRDIIRRHAAELHATITEAFPLDELLRTTGR
jgi:hypothetical protein